MYSVGMRVSICVGGGHDWCVWHCGCVMGMCLEVFGPSINYHVQLS